MSSSIAPAIIIIYCLSLNSTDNVIYISSMAGATEKPGLKTISKLITKGVSPELCV